MIKGGRKNKHMSVPSSLTQFFLTSEFGDLGQSTRMRKMSSLYLLTSVLIFTDVVGKILVVKSKILLNEYQIVPGIFG